MERIPFHELRPLRGQAVDAQTLGAAGEILAAVRARGQTAVREFAERFGDLHAGQPLTVDREILRAAFEGLSPEDQGVLTRTADRIRRFAVGQRAALKDFETEVECGRAGHEVVPVETAGCYAPGGRYPLPSSVLMTAVTARAAGVREIWVASPKPSQITLAAAHVAGADGFLQVGGAQAIGALAYGCGPVPPCDAVVGPGNRWVTAAKQLVAGSVAIDMLAGPSELAVLSSPEGDPALIAADMLAQAEHDPDASAYLVTWSKDLVSRVETELEAQQASLTNRVARPSRSWSHDPSRSCIAWDNARFASPVEWGRLVAIEVENLEEGIEACNRLAPEHLELVGVEPTHNLRHYGALFSGRASAEVFGDYGAGPNHTLPTGGTSRSFGGLSVFTFLRIRTWMQGDDLGRRLRDDTIQMARWEGLESHARAAERRISS